MPNRPARVGLIEDKPLPFAVSRSRARVSLGTYSEETDNSPSPPINRTKDVIIYSEEFDDVAVAFGRFSTPNVRYFDSIGEGTILKNSGAPGRIIFLRSDSNEITERAG